MPTSPYIYEDGTTDAERYLTGCLDGTYVVGTKIKQLAERMLKEIDEGYEGYHYDPNYAIRPVAWIEKFCCLTTGKPGTPFILEPYERNILELTFGFVDDNNIRRFREVLLEIARKNGKAICTNAQLPTPVGWRRMGDIHPGDYVFGQDGKPSLVIAESEIFDKPTYRVTFEDGAVVDTSGDHIWTVQTKRSRGCAKNYLPGKTNQITRRKFREGGWFETTTEEMYNDKTFLYKRADGKGVEYKYRIPMCEPVEYPEKELPVDPYTFGTWLGDGSSNRTDITTGRQDVGETVALLEGLGHSCTVKHSHDNAFLIRVDKAERGKKNAFRMGLKSIGALNNKHIPDIYLQASINQRWELLRGLMDTDGYVSKAGQCQFCQKRENIADGFVELCASLGIKANKREKNATINGKDYGTVYVVEFWTDKERSCFHLKRKHERLKEKLSDRMKCKSIVSIERIPNVPTKCIAIDNPSHLYLVGRHYTATHNTELCAALNLYMLTSDGELAPQCYNAATNSSQAALCYGATMDMISQSRALSRYLEQGNIPRRKSTGIKFKKEFSKQNLGYLVTLTRNSSALDGLNVHYAVLDELAALRDAAVYSLTTGSTGSQEQPLIFMPSTENYVRDGVWDQRKKYAARWLEGAIHDPHFLGICYEMDDRSEMFVEEAWPKANPGLGTVKKWSFMRSEALKAKNDPTNLPEFLTKQLNLPSNQAAAFLTFEAACNDETYEFDPKVFKYCYIGIDAADSVDLSAATALFMRPGDDRIYRRSMYWVPEVAVEQLTNNTRQRDGVPYKDWEARGLVRLTPGNKVPRTVFLDFIQELADEGLYCKGIAYDPWHMEVIEDRMKMMVGEANLLPLRQGAKTLSQPMKQIKADLVAHRIVDNANPIDHWCNMNIAAVTDRNGEVLPVKKAGPTSRIDGFMSLLFAYAMLMQRFDEYQVAIN